MSNHDSFFKEIAYLTCLSIEGKIDEDHFARLENLLQTKPLARECYLMLINNDLCLHDCDVIRCFSDESLIDSGIDLQGLADYERIAPAIEIPQKEPQPELIQSVQRQKVVFAFSKRSLFTLAVSVAAILFFVIFLRVTSPQPGKEVAIISDSIHAKWANDGVPVSNGSRLMDNTPPLLLREGYAELLFDNHAQITIQGPAEFQILESDMIKLNYGRLYSVIPPEAYGFQVSTPHSKIIDLGTEFGVKQDMDGDTEIHVLKGKTVLVSGIKGKKINIELSEGQARKLDGATGSVRKIACNRDSLIRQIDSKSGLIWKGQSFSLADVVGDGNGFGTGAIDKGIDPVDPAEFKIFAKGTDALQGDAEYHPFAGHPYIDGVFVPNGEFGPVQISSEGHQFIDFPVTDNQYWSGIFNGAWHEGGGYKIPRHNFRLDGAIYGTISNPAICMHANQGITFDLNAIRSKTNVLDITRFTAKVGLSESVFDHASLRLGPLKVRVPKASFYVLIDGQVKFEAVDRGPEDKPLDIGIELSESDRFLTLVASQGSDGENTYDWALFAEPFLHFEMR